ncbi:FAD-binding oxidoreductase [Aureimonas leprariae]|uniref:FAD-binding oxidoreductase n=1 Tax=Plantimonas leprariae TaxID=2615207 RepID=A0A7V7PLT1_9HYPH|nr:FAD-binding oxidoreductase [Aureimonas leprariae]KAB0677347.1 FAD-binding oxidoreductase [Aureimonas leprariae]
MTSAPDAAPAPLDPPNAAADAASDAMVVRTELADRALFNGAVTSRPLAFAECADEAAVVAALGTAADLGLCVAALAGGHDVSGRAFVEDNLVLDLRRIRDVRVDPAASEVTFGGGALTGDVLAALPDGLVTATGTVLSVGMTGLALGGGYGRLVNRLGLAADCMRSARVVLADGSVVLASEREDAELFWALRGGGSGFGIVTSMTMALHALPRVLGATVLYPLDRAEDTLLRAQATLDSHPFDLSLFMGFVTAPTGEAMLFVAPMWSGDPATGEALIESLTALDGALVLERGWCRYRDTLSEESEKAWPKGRRYHLPTRTLGRLDETAVEMLVDAARRMTSPHSAIVLHDFHGAAAQVPPDATAFALREDHFVVEIIAAWDSDPGGGSRHRRWADELSAELAIIAIPGGYVNLLAPAESERVRRFYGLSAQRLADVKRRVDPNDMFRSGIGRLVD